MQNPTIITRKMELRTLQPSSSTTLTTLPLPRYNLVKKRCLHGQFFKFYNPKKYPGLRKLQNSHIRAQISSGVTRFSSSTVEATSENVNSKDADVVFVAGATGRVGSRAVRELLKLGFQVRAGVRNVQRAGSLVQSVRQMKLENEATSGLRSIEKLEIVECDLEKSNQIVAALGTASVVICCIGASEKEIFDITGPYRIDYQATKNLIDAATVAKVNHFILLTSLGTNKIGFPAAILNLFWGVLIWKRKAEEALIASGLPYTIVRPGGMERPTDSYKETHNIVLSQEDTLFGGQVSNLQVAELMAFMAQNRNLSYCKIVEVVAETTAPLTPMEELLMKIPSKQEDVSRAEMPEVSGRPAASSLKSVVIEEENAASKRIDAEPAKRSISEVPTDVTGNGAVQERSVVARPLSPYTAYDDLKPPSSPCPTAPGGKVKQIGTVDTERDTSYTPTVLGTDADTSKSATVEMREMQPLSPFVVYEDLKPPSSPSPSPPGNSSEESLKTSKTVDGVPKVIDGSISEKVSQDLPFYHSPFPVYDDLKPPTSPSPTAPNSLASCMTSADAEFQTASMSTNDAVEPVKAQNADDQISIQPKPRPLSPYTMYDDMKPPTSPMPSPRNH